MPQISFSAIPDLPPLCLEHRPRKQAPDYQALSFINPRRQIGYYSAGAVVLKDSFAQLYPVLAKAVFWHYVPERQAMVLVPKELHLSTDELQSLLRDQGTRGVLAAALRALKTASTEESNLPQSQSQAQSQSQSQPKPQPLSVLFVEANGITLQSLQEATPIKSPVVAEVSEYASVDAQSLPESERAMHEHFMDLALEQARLAGEQGEVPVGAVIVNELNIGLRDALSASHQQPREIPAQ